MNITDYGTSGRAGALHQGMAKAFPATLSGWLDDNVIRSSEPNLTGSRNVNYRNMNEFIKKRYNNTVLGISLGGSGKNRFTQYAVLVPTNNLDTFGVLVIELSFRNPRNLDQWITGISISRHAMERLFQRYAGTDPSKIVEQLQPLLTFYSELGEGDQGVYEVGTHAGMAIVAVEIERQGDSEDDYNITSTVITWVDKAKLSPTQSAEVGVWKLIDEKSK